MNVSFLFVICLRLDVRILKLVLLVLQFSDSDPFLISFFTHLLIPPLHHLRLSLLAVRQGYFTYHSTTVHDLFFFVDCFKYPAADAGSPRKKERTTHVKCRVVAINLLQLVVRNLFLISSAPPPSPLHTTSP